MARSIILFVCGFLLGAGSVMAIVANTLDRYIHVIDLNDYEDFSCYNTADELFEDLGDDEDA